MELAGTVWDVATCLFSCCKVECAYVCNLDENLESLKAKWEDLQNLNRDVHIRIDEAERTGEMQRTNEVQGWLQRVQNLQEVLDNILCQDYEETHNKCLRGRCPKNCLSSYKLGKKVVGILNKVDELLRFGERFVDTNTIIAYNLPPNSIDQIPLAETVGLDLMFNKVWSSLEDENVSIIGLYGMGGVGKTTLLKRIHNEFEKRKHEFKVVLWVVVSKDVDINKIMDDIGSKLGIKGGNWNEISPDQRAKKIYQVIRKEKFVLMLDDLWEKLELDKVGVPQPNVPEYKSKILFTTRSKDVCAKMQAQQKFKVECLLENEAFSLFSKKVGEETLKCHGEIPKLARDIVKECGGLPLALVTVGSAMAGVESVEAWRQAKSDLRSSPWTASEVEKKVFSILKFSYDKLPDDAHKRCFLYCSLYPEDYEIGVDDLIDRWIGEGFLGEDKTKKSIYNMYVQGKSIVEKLKLSCLLEGVVEKDIYDIPCIKMHDVIREMALWLARDEDRKKARVVVEGEALAMTSEMDFERLKVVERISMRKAYGRWQVPVCPNLITLCMQSSGEIIGYSNLQYMTKLKVLDLSTKAFEDIPPEIGKLINLEFLNLSYTSIENRLPIELKNMKKLRILLMEFVSISLAIIPLEVIESLEQLKVFRFRHGDFGDNICFELEKTFLEKLESLTKLEELCMQLTTITGMHKLLESPKLRGCSTHYDLRNIQEPLEMTSMLESLSTMKHLECICFFNVQNIMEGSSITYRCHLHNLHEVCIVNCNSITHLTWLRYAPLLKDLRLYGCESIEEVVKEDGGSDRDQADNDIFQCLTRLVLTRLPKLKSIHKRALTFPFLKFIYVNHCPNLRKLPLNSNSTKHTLIKINGQQDWWNNLEWEDPTLKDQLQSKVELFRSY